MASRSKPIAIIVLQFMEVLQRELNEVEKEKEEFIQDFSEVRTLIFYTHSLFVWLVLLFEFTFVLYLLLKRSLGGL